MKWDIIISSSLRKLLKVGIWYRCQNRKSFHHDEEQLLFYKKVHIKTQSNEKDVLVIFVLLQETNFNLFDKKCTRENVKCHPYSTWKKLTWMNRNWTGRLQVTLLSTWHLYFLKEIVLAHFHSFFKGSNLDAFWENKGKIHERGCVKEFFP